MKIGKLNCTVFTLIISLVQVSCDSQGHGGISNNIQDSKNRKVYVCEYQVNPNPYKINDSLTITVIQAWAENQWSYGAWGSQTIIDTNEYQLVIEVDDSSLKNYGLTWTIGVDGDRYIRSCGENCLVSDFRRLPKDVEEWEVQNGWKLDSISKKTIIGSFRIFKKLVNN